jgi:signal transduction histidine kinase
MAVRTALDALTLRPTRLVRGWWPWRSLLYLVSGALFAGPVMLLLFGYTFDGVLPVVGMVALAATPVFGVVVAKVERWRLRLVDNVPLPDPHRALDRPGPRRWLRVRLREQATWREAGHAALTVVVLGWLDFVLVLCLVFFPVVFLWTPMVEPWQGDLPTVTTMLLGVALAVAAPFVVTAWAGARGAMARAILAPRGSDRLGERLIEVTRSRARLVDAFEVERRRIERDLHDGAQQRLVALNVQLGLARLETPLDSAAAEPLARAHDLAKQALTELRELIRGVHPKVLTDRGLAAAVHDVAGRSPVPVDVSLAGVGRLPPAVEVTAYFVVVEALTNVARHARASRASVTASVVDGRLVLRVRDDGAGGADPARGSGLAGLADRVAAVGGTVALSSPPGGPTVVQVSFEMATDLAR